MMSACSAEVDAVQIKSYNRDTCSDSSFYDSAVGRKRSEMLLAGSGRRKYCSENRPDSVRLMLVPFAIVQSILSLAADLVADVAAVVVPVGVAAAVAAAGSYYRARCDTVRCANLVAGAKGHPSGSWPIP